MQQLAGARGTPFGVSRSGGETPDNACDPGQSNRRGENCAARDQAARFVLATGKRARDIVFGQRADAARHEALAEIGLRIDLVRRRARDGRVIR